MADLNKQALEMWNAMKPMVDREIDQQTRGAVQRRKAKVTTAPSLVTKKIGVTEPFGAQYFIPFNTNLSTAKVGDVVWVEYMYGATNAFASMYASADTKNWTVGGVLDVVQRRCSASLSSAGWYRVMQTKDVAGTIIDFRIGRPYDANPAEAHKISFYAAGSGKSAFLDETSDTNTLCVDKIRATYGGGFMYFDVHYNTSSANEVLVYFDVYGKGQANGTSIAMGLASVADAPSGETVLTTYTFAANGSSRYGVVEVRNKTTTGGAYRVDDALFTKNSKVVGQIHYFSAMASVAYFVTLQPDAGFCNVYIRLPNGSIPSNGTKIDLDIFVDNR